MRTQIKVRPHGIDCPESGQDFGQRAKQFTSVSTFGQVVTVRPGTSTAMGGSSGMSFWPTVGR